jgi:oligopeptidase A
MVRQSLLSLGQHDFDETSWYLTREEAELSGELPKFGNAERVAILRSELDELEGCYNSEPEGHIALVPRMLELRALIASELGYSSFNEKQLRGLMMSHIGMLGLRRLLPRHILATTKKLDDRAMYEDLYTAQDVLRGVFHVFRTRYGLTLTKTRASGWNENVSFYTVYRGGTLVGGLYLDLFARKGKMKGSWVTTLRDGTTEALPLVVLVSDLKKGRKNSHHQLLTVLHESGHALHHLFAHPRSYLGFVRYVEEDAMEVFGRFFERYAFEEEVIRAALPGKTSEAEACRIVRWVMSAKSAYLMFDRRYDLAVSAFDQDIHAQPKRSEEEIRRTWKKIYATYIGGKDADRLPPSLRSVFGGPHSARFVIYVWADILAAQMFHQYQMLRKRDSKKAEHVLLEMFQKGSSAPFWDISAPLLGGRATAKSYLAEMKGV